MSQCNLGEPWRVQMNEDIREAAAGHPELTMVFKDAQNDTLKQRAHVEEFVGAGVDLIIISPKEAQPLTEPVAKAMILGLVVRVDQPNQLLGHRRSRDLVERRRHVLICRCERPEIR
jgi:ribose transport system substrate-binding protein